MSIKLTNIFETFEDIGTNLPRLIHKVINQHLLIYIRQDPYTKNTTTHIAQPVEGGHDLVTNLLQKAHADYDINREVYKANHLAHGMYTLYSLGASKSRLQQFYDTYVKKLDPLRKPNFTMNSYNWIGNIGNKLYPEFLQYFDGEIASKGLKDTFNLYIGQLLAESLGAALHPLIHIGFAIEFSNSLMLSEGISYACISPLQNTKQIFDGIDSNFANSEITVSSLIEELQGIKFTPLSDGTGGFTYKMEFLLENHGTLLKNLIAKWDLTQVEQLPAKLNELTEASILAVFATYSKQIDFFLLHGLTGNHAVRTIFPQLPVEMQRKLLRVNLLGLLLDYAIQRRPEIDVDYVSGYKESESDESITWDNVVNMAVSNDEVHVSKVVRSIIYYMETVPMSQRSALFSENFLKRCAFKAVDVLRDGHNFTFK